MSAQFNAQLQSLPDPPGTRPPLSAYSRPVGTSFLLHSGLSVGAWALGYATGRAEAKDWLWPSGMVANAWLQGVVIPAAKADIPISAAWAELGWRQKLVLTGATAWGLRLFYRIASRALRRGKDDPRYEEAKTSDPHFWRNALLTQYLPEATIQTLITLPFTAPFRVGRECLGYDAPWTGIDNLAVGLLSAGLTLEVMADAQVERHKRLGDHGLVRNGVWSIVRHPNYLADALVHLSFPLLLLPTPAFHPILFLGPIANYFFLRFIGGDKENEATQEKRYAEKDDLKLAELKTYQRTKNSFWPGVSELANVWTWVIIGSGGAGVVLERIARAYAAPRVL